MLLTITTNDTMHCMCSRYSTTRALLACAQVGKQQRFCREQWKGGNKHIPVVAEYGVVRGLEHGLHGIYPQGHIREVTPLVGAMGYAERM